MKRLLSTLFILTLAWQLHATIVTINVSNFVFTPNAITASCTDTIRFHRVNGTHPVVSETGAWATFTMSAALINQDIVLGTAGTYAYYCSFHGGAGGIGMAGTITITCAPPSCDPPTGVTASMITSTSAKITWTAVVGATKYQLQFRQVGVATWTKTNAMMPQKNLMGLLPATTYQYKVKTICGLLKSPFCPTQTFTTLPLKGEMPEEMEDMGEHVSHIGVFPNPSNGNFQLVLDHVYIDEVFIQIYDMTGRLIYENTLTPLEDGIVEDINLPDGFSGKAILKADIAGKMLTHDILVQ